MRRTSLTGLVVALLVFEAIDGSAQTPWAVYYAQGAPLQDFDGFGLLVFDSQNHPPLAAFASRGTPVLGYLSVGEVEDYRPYFGAVRAEGILLTENQNWKGSYFVDVRDPRWVRRVLDELIPQILQRGFAGVFLDTLDNPPHLERLDSRRYGGMTAAAADLVVSIRRRYPRITIMMNRGYELLPAVETQIDYILGESVFADFDFDTKHYRYVSRNVYEQQRQILKAAQRRNPHLQIFTLDYWSPTDAAGIARIYAEQRRNGFNPYVATVELDRIVREPRP